MAKMGLISKVLPSFPISYCSKIETLSILDNAVFNTVTQPKGEKY